MINQMAALKCRCSASVCVSMHSCRRLKKKKHCGDVMRRRQTPHSTDCICALIDSFHASVCVMSELSSDVRELVVFPSSASFVLSVPHLLSS